MRRTVISVLPFALAAVALGISLVRHEGVPSASVVSGADAAAKNRIELPYPSSKQLDAAKKFAASSSGTVSFAVIGPGGEVRGLDENRQFSSASVSKALLLAGYLRSHKGEIDPGTKGTLSSMIRYSDNDAASTIYSTVGDEGLRNVARRAGMKNFEPTPGFWGGAQITAADMARFFNRLDRNLAGPHRSFGRGLLAGISPEQRWGIPAAAGGRWQSWFKGGWRPSGSEGTSGAVSHQAGLVRHKRTGAEVAIAVLTDQTPGEGGGYSTIEGIANRLVSPAPHRD